MNSASGYLSNISDANSRTTALLAAFCLANFSARSACFEDESFAAKSISIDAGASFGGRYFSANKLDSIP